MGTPPPSIIWFQRLYLCFALVWLAHSVITIDRLRFFLRDPEQMGLLAYLPVTPVAIALRLAVALFMIWLIRKRASNIARWIVTAYCANWVYRMIGAWPQAEAGNPAALLWALGCIVSLAATACLFLSGAREWFARKGRMARDDIAVFE